MTKKGTIITSDKQLKSILEVAKKIVVVGLSPKPDRDSNKVAKYLKEKGYQIIPVRPAQKEILGEKAYKSMDDIDGPVDIINVFRNSEQVPQHVDEAIRLGAKVFWMQLGIQNDSAAEKLTDAGIDVVMDRCIKVDHDAYFNKNILV